MGDTARGAGEATNRGDLIFPEFITELDEGGYPRGWDCHFLAPAKKMWVFAAGMRQVWHRGWKHFVLSCDGILLSRGVLVHDNYQRLLAPRCGALSWGCFKTSHLRCT